MEVALLADTIDTAARRPPSLLTTCAAAGAWAGAVAAPYDVLGPSGVDMDAYLAGAVIQAEIALVLHVVLGSVAGLAFGGLLAVSHRVSFLRRVPWPGYVAVVTALVCAMMVAMLSTGPSPLSYSFAWLTLVVLAVGTSAAMTRMERGLPPGVLFRIGAASLAALAVLPIVPRAATAGLAPDGIIGSIVAIIAIAGAALVVWWLAGSLWSRLSRGGIASGITVSVVIVALLLAPVLLVVAPGGNASGGGASSAGGSGPNVILISVDTLRADFVGYLGERVRTPNIDRLASQSFVFERAYSVAPWTRPSFASFFGGRYPSEMGVARVPGDPGEGERMTPYRWRTDVETFPEILHAAGYSTTALVSNVNLTPEVNADQGFEVYRHLELPPAPGELRITRALSQMVPLPAALQTTLIDLQRADVVTTNAPEIIDRSGPDPRLLWFHYMDPHSPYDSPEAPQELQLDIPDSHTAREKVFSSSVSRHRFVNAYIAEIEYFDAWLGRLEERLRDAGLWEDSLVIFWSDHGEEFGEHGAWEHGQSLFEEQLHVPLLIRMPGQREGRRVEDFVTLLDLAPTILEICGAQAGDGMHGRSLAPVLEDGASLQARPVFIEACDVGPIRKGWFDGRHKLIYDVQERRFSLYDVIADPAERHDIHGLPGSPELAGPEEDLLAWTEYSLALMSEHAHQGAADVPEDVQERLRDLGYVQ